MGRGANEGAVGSYGGRGGSGCEDASGDEDEDDGEDEDEEGVLLGGGGGPASRHAHPRASTGCRAHSAPAPLRETRALPCTLAHNAAARPTGVTAWTFRAPPALAGDKSSCWFASPWGRSSGCVSASTGTRRAPRDARASERRLHPFPRQPPPLGRPERHDRRARGGARGAQASRGGRAAGGGGRERSRPASGSSRAARVRRSGRPTRAYQR